MSEETEVCASRTGRILNWSLRILGDPRAWEGAFSFGGGVRVWQLGFWFFLLPDLPPKCGWKCQSVLNKKRGEIRFCTHTAERQAGPCVGVCMLSVCASGCMHVCVCACLCVCLRPVVCVCACQCVCCCVCQAQHCQVKPSSFSITDLLFLNLKPLGFIVKANGYFLTK